MMKRPAVLIEGPDCSGKGQVAEEFTALGFDYYHFGPPEADSEGEYVLEVYSEYAACPGATVFDRSHLGEQVYGPIYRSGSLLTRAGQDLLEKYLETRAGIVILCLPDKATAYDLWRDRANAGGEMFNDRWNDQYDAFAKLSTGLPTLRYDWTRSSAESLMERYWKALRFWYGRRSA